MSGMNHIDRLLTHITVVLLSGFYLLGQITPSSAPDIDRRFEGPITCSGRVTALAVDPLNPDRILLGSASGGLWQSEDGGAQFRPIFEMSGAMAIGTVAINPHDPREIWVGGGECNPSLYSFPGRGLFISHDGGQSWTHHGLDNSSRIARIRFHPKQSKTAWVAVLGNIDQDSTDRGIYKSDDGGLHWRSVLSPGPDSGCIDLLVSPRDPDMLWAASWTLRRHPDHLRRCGPSSTIWISRDGGENWIRSGFSSTDKTGRIGLDLTLKAGKVILYAAVDDLTPRPRLGAALTAEQLSRMNAEELLKVNSRDLQILLDSHQIPRAFDASWIKSMVSQNRLSPRIITEFLKDEEARRLSDDAIGLTLYRSPDLGVTWQRTHKNLFQDAVYSYGFYFGQVRCSPKGDIYLLGVPLLRSQDDGRTFTNLTPDQQQVHRDMHDLWIDPLRDDHLRLATDGGIYESSDHGKSWAAMASPPLAQAYRMAISPQPPYDLYVGLQDNGIFCRPTLPNGPWQQLWGGDGTVVIPDPKNSTLFYGGHQHGNLYRFDRQSRKAKAVRPRSITLSAPYRFNWLAPALQSAHDPDCLYLGASHLLFSANQGGGWIPVSPDLSGLSRSGELDVPYGTIGALAESPFDRKRLYIGYDSGRLWRSRNGGSNWQEIGTVFSGGRILDIIPPGTPAGNLWVLTGGLPGEPRPSALYMSANEGDDWAQLDIPRAAERGLRRILIDPGNPALMFLAGDEGIWFSADRGRSWSELDHSPLPPIFDLFIHPRTRRLYAASHGQGIFSYDLSVIRKQSGSASNPPPPRT